MHNGDMIKYFRLGKERIRDSSVAKSRLLRNDIEGADHYNKRNDSVISGNLRFTSG